jgi:hypothetical protein
MSALSLEAEGSAALCSGSESVPAATSKNGRAEGHVGEEEEEEPARIGPPTENIKDSDGEVGDASMSDDELLQQAEAEASQERYFVAARLIGRVSDPSLLQPKHAHIVDLAHQCQRVVDELTAPPDEGDAGDHPSESPRANRRPERNQQQGWIKQGELHQHHPDPAGGGSSSLSGLNMDTLMYYKVHDLSSAISCRIDSTLDPSLLVPLLSVFNESDLYATWMPSWRHPKLGVRKSAKLAEMGRGNQIIHVTADMPFPITNRECVLHGCAVDDIDERASIVIKMRSLEAGQRHPHPHGGSVTIPPPERGNVRVDLDAGMLIRACPPDHPVLRERGRRRGRRPRPHEKNDDEKDDDHVLLFSLYQQVDANVRLVPMSLINFFTRTVLSRMWHTLIDVATEVRDGRRPDHQNAIRANPDLYEWVERRVEVMLSNVKKEASPSVAASSRAAAS